MIEGLNNAPQETAHGTSILLGRYMLTLRAHKAHPDRVQILLTEGRNLLQESWIDKSELRNVVDPVIELR